MMKMNCIRKGIGICVIFFSLSVKGQDVLTKQDAVQRALENNFGIRISQNASEIALNNTSRYNTGQLPTVGLNGGYNYNLDNTTANFQDGRSTTLSFAPSQGLSASVDAQYVLFDGFIRKYNIEQLKEQYNLSNLEVEAAMENVAAQTLSQYYQIAALSENKKILQESMDISKERLRRAQQTFDFGQGNKLAVLNAQVDLNNDSLSFYDINLQIDNAKRILNNIMVEQDRLDYMLEPDTDFLLGFEKETMKSMAINENIQIAQIDKSLEIGNLSLKMADARKLPQIGTSLSYGYAYSKNNSASFLSSVNNNGLSAGVTLSWNLFDGGTRRHAMEEIRLNNLSLDLQKEQLIQNLILDFENSWANYENKRLIYETQLRNVDITRSNFTRSQEQFEIGQINSVEYRQAQLNLLNAETILVTSKFEVKLAEVELLLLTGQILE